MSAPPAEAGGDDHARPPQTKPAGPVHRRRPVLRLVAAGTALVALVGVLVWAVRPREPDLTAVREAVEALLVAPAVRVRNGSVDGTVRADLLVTGTGEATGQLVVDGRPYEFLVVDGRQWLRSADGRLPGDAVGAVIDPASAGLAAELLASHWVAVDVDALHPTWRVPSPPDVAERLRAAIADPGAVELDDNGPVVDGRPTIAARTPIGEVDASQQTPHRVLRVAALREGGYALGAPASGLALVAFRQDAETSTTPPPAVSLEGAELDLTDLGADGARKVYDDVEAEVPELAEAADASLQLSFASRPRLTCAPDGCSIEASVLASVRTAGDVTVDAVEATLTVDFSVGGHPAGRCDVQVRLTVNTPSPMACRAPEAAGVFTDVRNAERSAAIAATAPGGTARWRVKYAGRVVVVGRADVDVDEIRLDIEESREESRCRTRPADCPEPPFGGPFTGPLIPVNNRDAHADRLAEKLHGVSRVRFANDPKGTEIDMVNPEYIGEAKPSTVSNGSRFQRQAKVRFDIARQTGRAVYYHFEGGPPRASILDDLERYAERYDVRLVIDTDPL
jgi:hypothetical protein